MSCPTCKQFTNPYADKIVKKVLYNAGTVTIIYTDNTQYSFAVSSVNSSYMFLTDATLAVTAGTSAELVKDYYISSDTTSGGTSLLANDGDSAELKIALYNANNSVATNSKTYKILIAGGVIDFAPGLTMADTVDSVFMDVNITRLSATTIFVDLALYVKVGFSLAIATRLVYPTSTVPTLATNPLRVAIECDSVIAGDIGVQSFIGKYTKKV